MDRMAYHLDRIKLPILMKKCLWIRIVGNLVGDTGLLAKFTMQPGQAQF